MTLHRLVNELMETHPTWDWRQALQVAAQMPPTDDGFDRMRREALGSK